MVGADIRVHSPRRVCATAGQCVGEHASHSAMLSACSTSSSHHPARGAAAGRACRPRPISAAPAEFRSSAAVGTTRAGAAFSAAQDGGRERDEDEEEEAAAAAPKHALTQAFTEKPWFQEYSASQPIRPSRESSFRFWHDEKRFKGCGNTSLAQRALLAAGGKRMGGHIKSALTNGPMGWQHKGEWDVLWSPASTAHKVFPGGLTPGQIVSAMPGTQSICKKKKLAETLRQAYGDDAFSIIPRTYSLPNQVQEWRAWMQARRGSGGAGRQLWMLKTAQHLGKGLKLVPHHKAVKEMLLQYERAEAAKKQGLARAVRPYVAAQEYVENPLLIGGRKFGIRVWALVTSCEPLCVYLHRGGLVLFSNGDYDSGTISGADGAVSVGHVTNYAQNKDGEVWDLGRLREHLGAAGFNQMFDKILENTALLYAAAYAPMQREARSLGVPPGAAFEVMGLDFLVDAALHPWLLEVNSTPSLAVEHSDPAVERMIYEQKSGMVQDMFKLLQVPERFLPAAGARARPGAVPELRRPRRPTPPGAAPEGAPAAAAAAGASSSGRPAAAQVQVVERGKGAAASAEGAAERRARVRAAKEAMSAHFSKSNQNLSDQVLRSLVSSELELSSGSGFVPLMPLMPLDADSKGWSIPWTEADVCLRSWMEQAGRLD